MSDAKFSGAGEVREAHRFDAQKLAAWMAANVEGFEGPLTVEQFKGGQSNPTYRLVTPSRNYVLRRKPPGPILKGAHAVDREARVMRALGTTGFPVPHIHALCTDETVIGTWFYVMDLVEGRIFWDPQLPEIPKEQRASYFDAMNATIARLHSVDFAAIGLEDYGRPNGYFERQIGRWSRQYREDTIAGSDPYIDRLIEWLPGNIPPGEDVSIVHGDFRLDNLIFHPTEPKVLAVIDWELSTLGHPLADFSYHLMMFRMPRLTIPGLANAPLDELGIPDEASYVADYCRRTGRDGIAKLDFYLAFNLFRFAAICHGVKARMLRGNAASAEAEKLVADLPVIAELGWEQARKAGA
ncbi:phosphotransferase [Novosphingobium pentaromativorans]|uniref:Aminoglycoside phosphotransferase n=1 Tax=Novosphingobium pentaromativorans US6-1 TaxID=1088721 RepID=G6ED77_9SPHN|nr:phosphotransferase [Novosphingobium pentaromativorans]AIT79829.1 aminoglycoside phosphotransferase [Novosphingobium pentaromativorans US6-1]EHJ60740.1 aminoglycoside phosphotransferase [Novosphingobium pentaromativorans US6-1]